MSLTDGTDADALRGAAKEIRTLRHTHTDKRHGLELRGAKWSEDYLRQMADALDAQSAQGVFA